MSLPKKAPKAYLHIEPAERGFVIVAKKDDADVLAAHFLQHGISCHRETDVSSGEDVLQFFDGVDRAQVEQILDAYITAKGS